MNRTVRSNIFQAFVETNYPHTHTPYKNIPLSATQLCLTAIVALLMSSSEAVHKSTLTTSKSTGTQQNLTIKTDGGCFNVRKGRHLVTVSVYYWFHFVCARTQATRVSSHWNNSHTIGQFESISIYRNQSHCVSVMHTLTHT